MNTIIYTQKEKCRSCYACVRGCPCKAVKVENQLAEVISDLCVSCGNCVRFCAPKAKTIISDINTVRNFLKSNSRTIAVLDSSFPAAMPGIRPGQLVSALKALGFSEVMEDAFGAELVSREYVKLLKEKKDGPIFSSVCPAIVSYVEKFYPQMVDRLAPVVSPMIAIGRLIKSEDNQAKVVFIGPCPAKKIEIKDENVSGAIDAVLIFSELIEMFITHRLNLKAMPDAKFSGPKPDMARLFPFSGGLLHSAGLTDDIINNEIINAHGRDYAIRLMAEVARGDIESHFINLLFCHGCLNGPAIENNLSIFRRRGLISRYAISDSDPQQTQIDLEKYSNLDLGRTFKSRAVFLPEPTEEEIHAILVKIGKSNHTKGFNCGACGYPTCRDLAVAVARGQAEIAMCWPHLLYEFKETQAGLIQAEKLTSLGQLAASMAHEVNNPLSGVLVYTQLLHKKISKGSLSKETAQEYLNKMEGELNRSTKLIRNLLDFSRESVPSLQETDINDIILQAHDLIVDSTHQKNIKIKKELSPELPQFMADPDQLRQVCVNLILNAIQAMPNGGTLTLRTSTENGTIRIEVQDTGCGISKENMSKLFTPFFTTKKEVKGVGLGLAVSYGIIQRHHGRIEVKSKEGVGTTFVIHLPEKNAREN